MSDSESNVRLLPPSDTTPLRAPIPKGGSLCWMPPFQDGVQPLVSVFLAARAFRQIVHHCKSDLEQEVGGGLIGNWHADPHSEEQFVVVHAALAARFTRQGSAFLTFTQDTLVAMNDELEDRFPGRQLVGWYHTHPRMGVFLSHYDVWLHKHFFCEPWQVALVVEPHAALGGFFIRQRDGYLDPKRYFGFHELLEEQGVSVVHWNNLRPAEQSPDENQGEDDV